MGMHRYLSDQGFAACSRDGNEQVLSLQHPRLHTLSLRGIEFYDPAFEVMVFEIFRDRECGSQHGKNLPMTPLIPLKFAGIMALFINTNRNAELLSSGNNGKRININ
jgi:hypothetical protein